MEQKQAKSTSKTVSKMLLVVASLLVAASFFMPFVDLEQFADNDSIEDLIWEVEHADGVSEAKKEELIDILGEYSDITDMSNADIIKFLGFAEDIEPVIYNFFQAVFYGPLVIGIICALVSLLAKRSGVFVIPLILSLVSWGFYSLIRELFESEENMAGLGLDVAVLGSMASFVLSIVCMVVHKKKKVPNYQQMQQGQFGMGYGQMHMGQQMQGQFNVNAQRMSGQQEVNYGEHAAQSPISYGAQDMGSFLNEINQNNNQQ